MDRIQFSNGEAEIRVSALFKKEHGSVIFFIPALNLADDGPTRDRAEAMAKEAIALQVEDLHPSGCDFLAHYDDLGWKKGETSEQFVLSDFNDLPSYVKDIIKDGYLSCEHELDEITVKLRRFHTS